MRGSVGVLTRLQQRNQTHAFPLHGTDESSYFLIIRCYRPTMNAEEQFLAHLDVIEDVIRFVCRRRRSRPDEADDFRSFVHLRLIADDYAVLRKFKGNSRFSTYLTTVIQRLFLDYRVREQGRWRCSAAARKLGPEAEELEKLISRDGYGLEEAVELVLRQEVSLSREALTDMAARLPGRPPRRFEGAEELAERPGPEATAELALLSRERDGERRRLAELLRGNLGDLETEDRMILRLRYEQGFKIVDIARTLQLPAKPLYRRLEHLLRDLRKRLEERQVSASDIDRLFQE